VQFVDLFVKMNYLCRLASGKDPAEGTFGKDWLLHLAYGHVVPDVI
jgi:hypothetical protein